MNIKVLTSLVEPALPDNADLVHAGLGAVWGAGQGDRETGEGGTLNLGSGRCLVPQIWIHLGMKTKCH